MNFSTDVENSRNAGVNTAALVQIHQHAIKFISTWYINTDSGENRVSDAGSVTVVSGVISILYHTVV